MNRPNPLAIMADQFRNTTLQGMGNGIGTLHPAGRTECAAVFIRADALCDLREDPRQLDHLYTTDSPVIVRLKRYTFLH